MRAIFATKSQRLKKQTSLEAKKSGVVISQGADTVSGMAPDGDLDQGQSEYPDLCRSIW